MINSANSHNWLHICLCWMFFNPLDGLFILNSIRFKEFEEKKTGVLRSLFCLLVLGIVPKKPYETLHIQYIFKNYRPTYYFYV